MSIGRCDAVEEKASRGTTRAGTADSVSFRDGKESGCSTVHAHHQAKEIGREELKLSGIGVICMGLVSEEISIVGEVISISFLVSFCKALLALLCIVFCKFMSEESSA